MVRYRVDKRLIDDPTLPKIDAYGGNLFAGGNVYVVAWPDGVVKAGISGGDRRHRRFLSRGHGAQLIALLAFAPSIAPALDLERRLHELMGELGPQAFATRAEAQAYLGSGGGGYTDCFRLSKAGVEQVVRFLLDEREIVE